MELGSIAFTMATPRARSSFVADYHAGLWALKSPSMTTLFVVLLLEEGGQVWRVSW